jgi:hypothetical protein
MMLMMMMMMMMISRRGRGRRRAYNVKIILHAKEIKAVT